MQRTRLLFASATFLSLQILSPALAHEHEESSAMVETMHMGGGGQPDAGDGYMHLSNGEKVKIVPSYWNHPEHAGLMYSHIALMIVAWVLVLPPAVMLSVARSRLTLPVQLIFHLLNGLAIFLGFIYDAQTPDLYNKSHSNAGWIISAIAVVWTVMAVFKFYSNGQGQNDSEAWRSHQPISHQAMAEHRWGHGSPAQRWSQDSGQGTERNTESLYSSSRANSWHTENDHLAKSYRDSDHVEDETLLEPKKRKSLPSNGFDRYLSRAVSQVSVGRWIKAWTVVYIIIERCLAPLAFSAIMSGVVVYSGIFRGGGVFNGLAHFIKGGIFFWYGLLSFGRWMGCFSDFGWAWNRKPGSELVGKGRARIPTAEFTESFVIFVYGTSNVFLEHLSGWGKEWTMMDLEHISITILFFGGGLLGMLIESKRLRNLLNGIASENEDPSKSPTEWRTPKSYVHSLNPMPALVIMLLGIMMSSHHQHSSISAAIHKQWGTMFVGFALARGVTYITFWLNPPSSYLPTRPPSEIVTSFCLIGGGAIFMASNRSTVDAVEYYGLDAMFIFTVMMGLTALIMAWALSMVAIKAWAVRRQSSRSALRLTSTPA